MKDSGLYRFLFFFLLVICTSVKSFGQSNLLDIQITIDTKNKEIIQILTEIHKNYGLSMSYDEQIFNKNLLLWKDF
ncbi:Uncharacterised protein [Sphingobacterium spiritivorum]|uniref:Uncharacterized protein n=1 Tax=Sphingobacterium spiritivorum TaxID=258 RepID=A0A380CMI7_SPHSI|nr:Uncharacterised protein [Sphingobacterium spiritivorum]